MPFRAGGPDKGIRVLGRAVQIITSRAGHPETLTWSSRRMAWGMVQSSNPFLARGIPPPILCCIWTYCVCV